MPVVTTSTTGTVTGSVPADARAEPRHPADLRRVHAGPREGLHGHVDATVLSTAGNATLSVVDPSPTAPGHLVNGSFTLPQPLSARATNAANTGTPFGTVSGAPLTLLTYGAPVSGDKVTLEFKQPIASSDALRTGTYAKTLTYTLSTTQP